MLASKFAEPYKLIYRHRRVLAASVQTTLKARYAGSILGMGWVFLGPVLLLALYALIYAVVFRIRPTGLELTDYILYIFAGLIPFIAFGQALASGTTSLAANVALLENRVFPAELIPLREVLVAGAIVLVGGAILIAYKLLTGDGTWLWLLIIPVLFCMFLAIVAVVWAFALLNLVLRDTQQVVTYVVILLLVASPIAYTPEMLPAQFKLLLYLNPLAYYVMSLQSILVLGVLPPIEILLGCAILGFAAFHGMYHVFAKAKRAILDFV